MTFFISDGKGFSTPYSSGGYWGKVEGKGAVGEDASHDAEEEPKEQKERKEEEGSPLPVEVASEVMEHNVVTISDEALIEEALDLMAKRDIRQIPVIAGNGKLVGLLSERQLLDQLRKPQGSEKKVKVRDIMTKQILCARPFAGVREIAHVFFKEPIHSMPILDEDDHIVGIITRSDVLRTVMKVQSVRKDKK